MSGELARELAEKIEAEVAQLAAALDLSPKQYASVVTIWRTHSTVVELVRDAAIDAVSPIMEDVLGPEARPAKLGVVRKPPAGGRPTPCHQDATHSPSSPYSLSAWIALDDADETSSCLEFLPGSHRGEPDPPVDYWQPGFVDEMAESPRWRNDAVAVPVEAGDTLIFDPFVWHSSTPLASTCKPRRAITMRWTIPEDSWPHEMPAPEEVVFGMFNCGEVTGKLLERGHNELFGPPPASWEELSAAWRRQLDRGEPSFVDTSAALDALERLDILNRAHREHDAGDQQGIVYAHLWETLLEPLSDRLEGEDATD